MNFILDIFKNGIKYTFLFILFVILSILFSVLFTFGMIYYIQLWEIIPQNLHFILLILLPVILFVGLTVTIIQRIFNGSPNKVKKPKHIDIIELAKSIRQEMDNEQVNSKN
jgi:hypothetical protein